MKFSNYNIFVRDYPQKGSWLVFNTRTHALVKLDDELKQAVDRFFIAASFPSRFRYGEDLANLHEMGIIVADEREDLQRLENFFSQVKHTIDKKSFPIQILTTHACNFRCRYCFEEASRSAESLDIPTGDLVIAWLKKQLKKFGYEELSLVFYGGEPLLNPSSMEYICRQMQSWCGQESIRFKFAIQTNGFLVTPELVGRFLPLGLRHLRISLDGVGEKHDAARPLRNGGPTFQTIMKNIMDCVDKVNIGISVSYDHRGVEHIAELLDYLDDLKILRKLGRFLFSPIHPGLGPSGRPELISRSECLCNYEDHRLVVATRRIREILKQKGLPVPSGLALSICALNNDYNGVTIDAKGRLYVCNAMLGHPEFSVGDVRKDDFNDRKREFRDLDVWRQCPSDCPYLPICSGGCRLMAFMEKKDFSTPSCKKRYLDEMAQEFVKDEYETILRKRDSRPMPIAV